VSDPGAGLSARERDRLARFAAAFERLDASDYALYADVRPRPEATAAEARAAELARGTARRAGIRSAVATFVDAATLAYGRRMSLPDTFLLFQSLPDRADDRVRFLASVERAVVALILWDELDEGDRVALVGPWAELVAPIVDRD